MANEKNLKPCEYKLSREEAKRGGIASGKARREKADLRKMAQSILDGTFTDKNGKQFSGLEMVLNSLLANLANSGGKNWGKAMEILLQLTGANMSPEQRESIIASTEKIKAETRKMQVAEKQEHNGMLEQLIKGLSEPDDLHTETESPNADVATEATEATEPT